MNPGRIDAYVGALTSDMSADIAHVLNVIGIPQVSYFIVSHMLFTVWRENDLLIGIVPELSNICNGFDFVSCPSVGVSLGTWVCPVFYKILETVPNK